MPRVVQLCLLSFVLTTVSFAAEFRPLPNNEEELRERLKERVSFEFDEDSTFGDLIRSLREKAGIDAVLDGRGAGALGINSNAILVRQPIALRDIPHRSALRFILNEMDMAYYLKDNLLVITSVDEARNDLRSRIYPVGDLLERAYANDGKPPYLPPGLATNSQGNQQVPQQIYDWANLLDLIETVVAPDSWGGYPDGGDMMEFGDRLLVVRQTEEVHFEIEELLDGLRSQFDRLDNQKKLLEFAKTPKPVDKPVHNPPTPSPKRLGFLRR